MNPENINQIIEQIKPAMSKMAEQLGVSMDFLWEVLLKQQYVEGFLAVGHVIIGIIAIPFLVKFWKKCMKEMSENNMSDYVLVLGFVCAPLTLLVALIICLNFEMAVSHLVNPEYQAIKDIFEFIKGASN